MHPKRFGVTLWRLQATERPFGRGWPVMLPRNRERKREISRPRDDVACIAVRGIASTASRRKQRLYSREPSFHSNKFGRRDVFYPKRIEGLCPQTGQRASTTYAVMAHPRELPCVSASPYRSSSPGERPTCYSASSPPRGSVKLRARGELPERLLEAQRPGYRCVMTRHDVYAWGRQATVKQHFS